MPVYFAYETDDLDRIIAELEHNAAQGIHASAQTGGYKLVVKGRNPPISNPQLSNIVGTLQGAGDAHGSRRSHPVIAISAHYDAFAASPGLAYGSNDNGSGVVALLQLARMFSQLYARLETRPDFSLAFILTSGGPLDFSGTKHFLQAAEASTLGNFDFALCLDGLARWNETGALRLYHSRPPSADESAVRWYGALEAAAAAQQLPFEAVHRKVQLKEAFNAYEHEVWAKRRVLAATLTDRPDTAGPHAYSGSLLDRRTVTSEALTPVIRTIFDAIAGVVAGTDAAAAAAVALVQVQPRFIDRWLENMASVPRMTVFTTHTSKIFTSLQKVMDDALNVTVQQYTLTSSNTNPFFSAAKMQASIVNVASIWFEIALVSLVAAWCAVLYVGVTIATRGLDVLFQELRLRSKVTKKAR